MKLRTCTPCPGQLGWCVWKKVSLPSPAHMHAAKHNGQLAVQCVNSFPGLAFSSAVDIALESFGQKPLYCTRSVEMSLVSEGSWARVSLKQFKRFLLLAVFSPPTISCPGTAVCTARTLSWTCIETL